MAGLLAFAGSTGVLMTLADDFQQQQLKRLDERADARRSQHASRHPPSPGAAGPPDPPPPNR